jgi:hypothetical protein
MLSFVFVVAQPTGSSGVPVSTKKKKNRVSAGCGRRAAHLQPAPVSCRSSVDCNVRERCTPHSVAPLPDQLLRGFSPLFAARTPSALNSDELEWRWPVDWLMTAAAAGLCASRERRHPQQSSPRAWRPWPNLPCQLSSA